MKQYDVVIAGGAMTGASLALALDRLSEGALRIAVVEAVLPDQSGHPGYDARSIALSLGSMQLMTQLGLWPALKREATAISRIHVSDRGHAGLVRIAAEEYGAEALGYVIELAQAGAVFHEQLSQSAGIDLICPEKITAIERKTEHITLQLSSGESCQANLLVAADGGQSECCAQLGIAQTSLNFEQVAVIANVSTAIPHQGEAFERFTPFGPLALLPMSQGRSSLVWCVPPEQQQTVMGWDDDLFLQQLQAAFGWRLGQLVKTGQRYAYPLSLRQAERRISHRFAVVGNAAQTLHPIAGQGFNLGLRDVMTLAEEIVAGVQRGDEAGSMAVLSRFRQRREGDQAATIAMTTGLVTLFANEHWPMVAGRNAALMAMNAMDVLKAPLVKRAMGQVDR
ncbi:2-octaprenyl-6-methoxyphenyl hydroxylase [Photobacterium galatheae]|uniref:2-octaprenyl-6-methoxyphenyl hydroxylase n=1 Tax=Photobacterium galatheae TaxID=1654360 RepID=A0A066RQK9_9GAMM|nr:2-octaprenyl-6-methoxyphenyl hydroxylase [Photobacterium galatheae]KDM92644.1 2-octaprenyl-6-methoxyphenyl hydroxylase [Photobacterium galatheae]MCM0149437.1 2-octaprenyl-6-methoxyphenyl hydroxylase [Photobacterium galatheae]